MAKMKLLLVAALAACAASDDTPDLLAQAMAREEKANKQLESAQRAESAADTVDNAKVLEDQKMSEEKASKRGDEAARRSAANAAAAARQQAEERRREVEEAEERAEEAASKKHAAFCRANPKAKSCQSEGYEQYLKKYGMGGNAQGGKEGTEYNKYMKAEQYTKQGNEGGGYQKYMSKYSSQYGKYMKHRGSQYGDFSDDKDFGDYKGYVKKDYGADYKHQQGASSYQRQKFMDQYASDYKQYMKKESPAQTIKYWKDHDDHLDKMESSPRVVATELAADSTAVGATNFPVALLMGIVAVPAGGFAAHLAMSYKNAEVKPEGYIACDA